MDLNTQKPNRKYSASSTDLKPLIAKNNSVSKLLFEGKAKGHSLLKQLALNSPNFSYRGKYNI